MIPSKRYVTDYASRVKGGDGYEKNHPARSAAVDAGGAAVGAERLRHEQFRGGYVYAAPGAGRVYRTEPADRADDLRRL